MPETEMRIVKPTLPAGFCNSPASIIGLFDQLQVFFPGSFTIPNYGPNQPSIEDRNRPWIKTDATSSIILGLYNWSAIFGLWLKAHWNNNQLPASQRIMYVGGASSVDAFDGGESGTISATTGPFWQIDTDWNDKIPVGVGTTYTPVSTDFTPFTAGGAAPTIRACYMLKPSGRLYDRA